MDGLRNEAAASGHLVSVVRWEPNLPGLVLWSTVLGQQNAAFGFTIAWCAQNGQNINATGPRYKAQGLGVFTRDAPGT